ncbi:MAG: uracil phosphoribosyltransferase [Actinomycetia bacterium]|nr:uracil phosphoribosyltransferase [Actinomycetes bacterium]
MEVFIIDHPVAATRLTTMRDESTPPARFRQALHELSRLLVYEATGDLTTETFEVRTPMGPAEGERLHQPPLLAPVLRAGLGMLGAAQELLPESSVGFIGLRRNEETLEPDSYLTTVPADLAGRPVLVLDPMLATGGSAEHACRIVSDAGAGPVILVCALAAPEGIETLEATGLVDQVYTGAVDSHLDETAFIVPGLGDAGDRQFGAQ